MRSTAAPYTESRLTRTVADERVGIGDRFSQTGQNFPLSVLSSEMDPAEIDSFNRSSLKREARSFLKNQVKTVR